MASIVLLLLFLSKVYFSECCCAVGVWASGAVGASKVFLCVRIHEDVKAVVSFPETFHKRSTPGCTRLWDFEESSVCGGLDVSLQGFDNILQRRGLQRCASTPMLCKILTNEHNPTHPRKPNKAQTPPLNPRP